MAEKSKTKGKMDPLDDKEKALEAALKNSEKSFG